MLGAVRRVAKGVLPPKVLHWYRRRRELRIYFRTVGDDLWQQRIRFTSQELQGRAEAARQGFTHATVREMVERTDILLEAMERKIEGLTARHGSQIRALREEISGIRDDIVALRAQMAGSSETAPALEAAGTSEGTSELTRPD